MDPAEAFQIFVEMPTNPKKTATLMVTSKTTVGEVKAMVEAKEGGIPVARQRLRTRTGICLWPEELTLDAYHIGRDATLFCSPRPQRCLGGEGHESHPAV